MNTSFDHKDAAQNQRPSQRENQSAKTHPSRTIVHAKLEMTEPGDHDEQEADAIANAVVSGGKISRKISSGGGGSSGIAVSQQMENQLSQLQGGGRQMPEGLRNMMESGFGQDFSQVRLHTDNEAASMSSSIHAKAFTLGNDIYFNRGQFAPETTEGQRLVAHELTHVVQGTGKVGREPDNDEYIIESIREWAGGIDDLTSITKEPEKKGIDISYKKREREPEIINAFNRYNELSKEIKEKEKQKPESNNEEGIKKWKEEIENLKKEKKENQKIVSDYTKGKYLPYLINEDGKSSDFAFLIGDKCNIFAGNMLFSSLLKRDFNREQILLYFKDIGIRRGDGAYNSMVPLTKAIASHTSDFNLITDINEVKAGDLIIWVSDGKEYAPHHIEIVVGPATFDEQKKSFTLPCIGAHKAGAYSQNRTIKITNKNEYIVDHINIESEYIEVVAPKGHVVFYRFIGSPNGSSGS